LEAGQGEYGHHVGETPRARAYGEPSGFRAVLEDLPVLLAAGRAVLEGLGRTGGQSPLAEGPGQPGLGSRS